jgi:uncharacterized protein YfeS
MFQIKVVEKIKNTFYTQWLFCLENHPINENVEKYGRAKWATDDIMQLRKDMICMPDK